MKKLSMILVSIFLAGSMTALAQGEKRKSPAKSATGTIGETTVSINYGSPSMRDRDIYGGLVPFGKIWRAGANEATTMEFSNSVKINGQKLPKGKYAFFVTPQEDGNWSVTFNSEPNQWGAYKHDKSKDALVVEVQTKKIDAVENLTYGIKDNTVYLDWSTTRMHFEVAE